MNKEIEVNFKLELHDWDIKKAMEHILDLMKELDFTELEIKETQ